MSAASKTRPSDCTRILGIDPGTLRLGYGVIDRVGASNLAYVECGVISAPPRQSRNERLLTIGRGLCELLDELEPDEVAMEQAFYGKNVQATLALGEARGVALFVASDRGLSVVGYAPARVKLTIAGHGRAAKSQVGYLVRALLTMRRTPETDAADALAVAICHARHGSVLPKLATPARRGVRC
jgi:crossover junction endodeoxyribonuclease RuvC